MAKSPAKSIFLFLIFQLFFLGIVLLKGVLDECAECFLSYGFESCVLRQPRVENLLSVNTDSIGEYRRYYILRLLVVSGGRFSGSGDNEVDFA